LIRIDKLRLGLPAGFEHRAARISRLVGEHLARLPVPADVSLDSLRVGRLEVSPALSDSHIAARIASAVLSSSAAAAGQGSKG